MFDTFHKDTIKSFKELLTKFLSTLGFKLTDGKSTTYSKKYKNHDNYSIEVDFEKESINYGNKIKCGDKTTSNFKANENFVVLECVNRLLDFGYKPENIILEKIYPSGHGTSGKLDICVTRDNGSEYLLIECKTYGKEFNNAFTALKKDGGQLFTYFKFSNKADIIMLYASELNKNDIIYKNENIKIEDDYRTGDVKDFYDKWNKLTKDNGVLDNWVTPYQFISKALTPKMLNPIKQEDSGFIFNRFLEILRNNVVSDKPNAFNKIFTLFLCKVYDEKSTKETEELKFQWIEGKDDDISFQLRLMDLYKNGMLEFLEKQVTDFSEEEFENKFKHLNSDDKKGLLFEIYKLRLEKNNEFAIKEVFDHQSFKENAKVVKQVVELLQGFRIRYNKRQQYLSDFFELLLTTGLKQESGQFFTPVPIAQFIIKSLPIASLVNEKLEKGESNNLLPYIMDYAAGSGHFLTESMHEIQRILDQKNPSDFIYNTCKKIKSWQEDNFDWATQYIYGIEKDYRLVKVGKVGCYLHGDRLANVILSDGLSNFNKTESYKGILKYTDKDFPKENKQFDVVLSNPPYSIPAFKLNAREYYTEKDFELYTDISDVSSEIECLFVERTQQLLKNGGIAGIILPLSIKSDKGKIFKKTREILLKYFEIIAICEMGPNTFMATPQETNIFFLRRRNNYESINLKKAVDNFFSTNSEVTLNGINKPITKYIEHVWEDLSFNDYITLLKKVPNQVVKDHEIYIEYKNKMKNKTEKEFWKSLIDIESEKLFYFLLSYSQRVVLVKSGEKEEEKKFLGYKFRERRGKEGIHCNEKGKRVDEITYLFDENVIENPNKVNYYIYNAFYGKYDLNISATLQKHVSYTRLIDFLTFNQASFQLDLNVSIQKSYTYQSIFPSEYLENILVEINGMQTKIEKADFLVNGRYPIITQDKGNLITGYSDKQSPITDIPLVLFGDHSCCFKYIDMNFFKGADGTVLLKPNEDYIPKFLYYFLDIIIKSKIENYGKYERHYKYLKNKKIPKPPIPIQKKVIQQIESLEEKAKKIVIKDLETQKENIINKYLQ